MRSVYVHLIYVLIFVAGCTTFKPLSNPKVCVGNILSDGATVFMICDDEKVMREKMEKFTY